MAKKTSKTNKTSHVLNLLTSGEGDAGNIEEQAETLSDVLEAEGEATPSASRKRRSVSSAVKRESEQAESQVTVIDEASVNDRLSTEIRKNLEESIREEAETAPAEKPKRSPRKKAEKAAEEKIEEKNESEAPTEQEKLIKKTKSVEEYVKDEIPEADTEEEEFHIVNVMAAILKQQDIPAFMAQYGCCTCKKCVADVNALALTRLPAKYVVLKKDVTSPMIGFYQSRYRTDILASLLNACFAVKDAPRHDR